MNYIYACLSICLYNFFHLNNYLDGKNSNMHRVKLRNVSGKALIRQMKLSLFPFYSMIAFAFTILSVSSSVLYGILVYLSHRYVLIKSHTEAAFMCFLEIHLPEEMTFCVENVMLTF